MTLQRILRLPALLALLLWSGAAAATEADMTHYTVEIQASDRVAYDVACTVNTGTEVTRMDFSGSGSLQRKFVGTAIRCSLVQTAGRDGLALVLSNDRGNRTRSATHGVGSRINIGIR
ncbi:MAG: hypothetical protein GVY13_09665 [Alphaproteobacteria bacterium]|nr:hypothetical protein [Alphaproteobacteria bacterium]